MNTEDQKGLKIADVNMRVAIAYGVVLAVFILLLILYKVSS